MNDLINQSKIQKIFDSIPSLLHTYRIPILGTLIPGILAYVFAFTNKLVNHDDVFYLFGKGATIESGRWGLSVMSLIFPDVSMPWIYGVISLALLAVSICFCIRLLNIRSTLLQFLLAGITVTFPSQIATFAYMFTASSYAVAFLMSVLAAYLLTLERKSLWLMALLCAVLCCSIYQSYIAVTSTLLLLHLLNLLLRTDTQEKTVFCKGIFYVVFLAVALGLYWLITNCIWSVSGTKIGEYAGNALSSPIEQISQRILVAYTMFRDTLLYGEYSLVSSPFSNWIHSFMIVMFGIEFLVWTLHNKNPLRILFLVILLCILPLSVCCMFLFVHYKSVHSLVLYGFVFLYYLLALLLEAGQYIPAKIKSLGKYRHLYYNLILAGLSLIIICNTYIANEAYLNLYLRYQNTYSFTTSVVSSLNNHPEFTSDSKVAFVGFNLLPEYWDETDYRLIRMIGISGIGRGSYSIPSMLAYYNGITLNFASDDEMEEIIKSDDFWDMTTYPYYGSIRKINDIFVVKISDVYVDEDSIISDVPDLK